MTTEATATEATASTPAEDPDSPDVPEDPKVGPSGKLSGELRSFLAGLRNKHAERVAAGDLDDGDGDVMPASVPDLAAPPAKTAPPPPKAVEPPAVVPDKPADSIAATALADATKARERDAAVSAREAALQAREAAIAEREAKYGDVGAKLSQDPLATIRAIATQWLGAGATDDEIAAEVGDMLTAASIQLAGAKLDTTDDKQAIRQMQRELRAERASKRRESESRAAADKRAAEEKAAQLEQAERDQAVQGALATIGREFKTIAEAHPFLAAEDDVSDLIWRVISGHHANTGEVMLISDAAAKLEAELATANRSKFSKFAHLLQPQTAGQAAAPATGQQGDHQRRSRPLTNADASEDAPAPEAAGFLTPAQMKRQSLKQLGPQFAALRAAARQEAGD